MTESDISEYYQHYALAQKLYNSLTNSVNEEVSDDEARVIEIMQIFVADSTKASDVAAKLERGDDFASVANNYNELLPYRLRWPGMNCPKRSRRLRLILIMDRRRL